MNFLRGVLSIRRNLAIAFAAGIVAAGAGLAGWSGRPKAESAMPVLDQLQAKEEIRQQLVLYGLLAMGDGNKPRDLDALPYVLMTPDVTSQLFFYDGTPAIPERHGRDNPGRQVEQAVFAAGQDVPGGRPRGPKVGTQHYALTVYFDALTPTTAKTRSQHMTISVTRNVPGGDCNNVCGGKVERILLANYFDSWVKTPDGWQKKKVVIRNLN